jgi:hypothetical protein
MVSYHIGLRVHIPLIKDERKKERKSKQIQGSIVMMVLHILPWYEDLAFNSY